MKIMLDEGAKMPTRAHPWDAGLDLYAKFDGSIRCNSHRTFDTGVHVEIPEGCVGFIKSKSGLMVNNGITTDGTIDAHYTGSIRVCLFNHGGSKYEVKAGDKIAQLVIVPCVLPPLELVDNLEVTDRGDKGFGSTGR
jgi:dUTP pyrophosphatase